MAVRALLLVLLLAGCAAADVCSGGKPLLVIELYFGRDGVSDSAWDGFLASVVTPRFPDGLTATEAFGQWRNPSDGKVTRERSTVVTLAVERSRYEPAKLAQVTDAYRKMFQQQSVGRLLSERCGSFD
jgi:hypothetical protein